MQKLFCVALLFSALLNCCALERARAIQYRPVVAQCINNSLSVWQKPRPSASLLDCFLSSRSAGLRSVGVVQRNRRDASCALFRFAEVCRLLGLINISSTPSSQADCDIVVDSEYDAVAANEHFQAVWVVDRGPAMENLVCGPDGQRNPMKSHNVEWTSEGARMDGVSSRLWVDDPTGLDFTASYTWVLHMRRSPAVNNFVELSSCINPGSMLDHLQENSHVSGVSRALYLNPGYNARFQTGSVMPLDPNEFFVAGVAFKRQDNLTNFCYGSSFVPTARIFYRTNDFNQLGACINVGWRFDGSRFLTGVVRAVAVANAALSKEAIAKTFFNGRNCC